MTVTELHPLPAVREPTMVELDAWVTQWVTQILERRSTNKRRWCPLWRDHPEVVTRMRILMLSHRQVVAEGDALAMSAWMLDHLDRHLAAIFDPDGPFAGCNVDRHSPHGGLPVEPMKGRTR